MDDRCEVADVALERTQIITWSRKLARYFVALLAGLSFWAVPGRICHSLAGHKRLRRCWGESGAQFLEYALLAALVAIATTGALIYLKDALIALWQHLFPR
jgi:Flp pilus assembly pilin Flp